jgi:hypothetical protein
MIDAEISHGMGEARRRTHQQHKQQKNDSWPAAIALIDLIVISPHC